MIDVPLCERVDISENETVFKYQVNDIKEALIADRVTRDMYVKVYDELTEAWDALVDKKSVTFNSNYLYTTKIYKLDNLPSQGYKKPYLIDLMVIIHSHPSKPSPVMQNLYQRQE